MTPADWLPFLLEIADRADRIALHHFRRPRLRVSAKPDQSPVSEADLAIEAEARALVAAQYPGLGILGEEAGASPGTGTAILVLDPIDGTRNFVRGIPVFATLLAIEDAGEVVAGVVSAPALGQRWRAARGGGAWCGGRRLAVSTTARLSDAMVLHGDLSGGEGGGVRPPGLEALIRGAGRSRGFGDFWQHMVVAEGGAEVAVDPVMNPWDIAAPQIIVEEAGGRATTLGGARSIRGGSLVTSNGLLHEEARQTLSRP